MKIWVDGSGWNGNESKYLIADEKGNIDRHKFDTAFTNNEMEYQACIEALNKAKEGDEILSDSKIVVNQINGVYKVREPRLYPLCTKAQSLRKQKQCFVHWIPREQNKAGHLLEK